MKEAEPEAIEAGLGRRRTRRVAIAKRETPQSCALPPGPQMLTSLEWGAIIVQAQQKPLGDLGESDGTHDQPVSG